MRAVVLNLARRPERLRRFLDWNGGHGLDIQVQAAVDGSAIDRAALVAEGVLAAGHDGFSDGALGNALSHRAQWQACVAEDALRLVFEDDACLNHSLTAQLPMLLRGLDRYDLLFLGYNTNAPLTLVLPDQMLSELYFGTAAAAGAQYYDDFATKPAPRPRSAVHPTLMAWGTIAYAVSPRGARKLLDACFPLTARRRVRFHVEQRELPPTALDGMINAALQAAQVRALACFPPLALSPNDLSDVCIPSG